MLTLAAASGVHPPTIHPGYLSIHPPPLLLAEGQNLSKSGAAGADGVEGRWENNANADRVRCAFEKERKRLTKYSTSLSVRSETRREAEV